MAVLSFRVAMGLPPTQEDENHGCRHPRVKLDLSLPKRGGSTSVQKELDSRLRGNDTMRVART
jgi:hypothetical protein